MNKKIARVFPCRTAASPVDQNTFFGPPGMFDHDFDEIHISTTFTWDKEKAQTLANQWEHVAPVLVGGPAYDEPSGEFVPGMYLRHGYVITSRGCPNRCPHCSVRQTVQELPIRDGWIVQDDNLLACSDQHILAVFNMLSRQPEPATLRGLEAKRLRPWHVDALSSLRISQMFFAYDNPAAYEPLVYASRLLLDAGYNRSKMRCYVYSAYEGDTLDAAEKRMRQVLALGLFPFAMLKKDERGNSEKAWAKFQREWTRPAIIAMKARENHSELFCKTAFNTGKA